MKLIYPSGSEVKSGDLVWFDEGAAIGYVHGVGGVGIVNENVIVDINLFTSFSNRKILIGIPYSTFNDEGVDLLTKNESDRLARALSLVSTACIAAIDECAVFTVLDNRGLFSWVVVGYGGDGNPVFARTVDDRQCDPIIGDFSLEALPLIAWPVGGGGS